MPSVTITADQNQVTVALEGQEPQLVESVDAALEMAKQALTQGQAPAQPTPEQDMAQGFKEGMGQPAGFGAR